MTASPATGIDTRDMVVVHDSIRRQFGQATAQTNFPAPFGGTTGGRTFRVAVGVRF